MVISRAEIYWADLGPPSGSQPAKRRPVLVIQSDPYNASRLATVIAAVITSNTALAAMPGNVFLPATTTRLPRDSVVNVTAIVTLNKTDLTDRVGEVPASLMHECGRCGWFTLLAYGSRMGRARCADAQRCAPRGAGRAPGNNRPGRVGI